VEAQAHARPRNPSSKDIRKQGKKEKLTKYDEKYVAVEL